MKRLVWEVVWFVALVACGETAGSGSESPSASQSAGTSSNSSGTAQSDTSDTSAGGGSTEGGTSTGTATVSDGSGGTQMCPPCLAPPGPGCIGSGPCGCGPYTCPGTGGSGGVGSQLSCAPVSGEYGDCEAIVGYGFDGTACKPYSGCDCGSDCAHLFPSAAACASSCAAQGECNTGALLAGGIAGSFTEEAYCDEVFACAADEQQADLEMLLPLTGSCEASDTCSTARCSTSLAGQMDADKWTSACSASLLSGVELTCWIWGP